MKSPSPVTPSDIEVSVEAVSEKTEYAAWIGIDWADRKHDICLRVAGQDQVERLELAQNPEAWLNWFADLRRRFGGREVAVCFEQTRGPILQALVQCEFVVLYPINPQSLAKFRQTFRVSGAKSDLSDAFYLLELLHKHAEQLPVWQPADATTRAVATLVESRRKAVGRRTAATNELQALLKGYYPQALELCGEELYRPLSLDWLEHFPTLQIAKRARPRTVEAFYHKHNCRSAALIAARIQMLSTAHPATNDAAVLEPAMLTLQLLVDQLRALNKAIARYDKAVAKWFAEHPDAELFKSLPGAGDALAPRLMAAFGSDRKRFPTALAMQCYSGLAPITQQSGKSKNVHHRSFCPTFIRQTFHEFARCSIGNCAWAKAYYAQQRAKGAGHNTAVRALAYKWVRIIWRMWQNRDSYDDALYTQALRTAGSPIGSAIPVSST